MRNLIVAIAAAGCCLTVGTPAQACSAGQRLAPDLSPAMRLNIALARLRVPPPDPSNHKKAEDLPANPSTIVGLWDIKYFDDQGQVDAEVYDLWHADGNEIEVDASNPIYGNVCSGAWIQTGTFTYKLTHPSWNFDGAGNLIGTVMIRDTVTLDPRGDKFSGTETVDVYDLDGNLVFHIAGPLSATRVKPV